MTSTATNWPNKVASTSKTSFIAAWFAPPPIQLPAMVVIPRQVSPATVSGWIRPIAANDTSAPAIRSEEHTSELQSLMRISYAVFCLKKKKNTEIEHQYTNSNHKLDTVE